MFYDNANMSSLWKHRRLQRFCLGFDAKYIEKAFYEERRTWENAHRLKVNDVLIVQCVAIYIEVTGHI